MPRVLLRTVEEPADAKSASLARTSDPFIEASTPHNVTSSRSEDSIEGGRHALRVVRRPLAHSCASRSPGGTLLGHAHMQTTEIYTRADPSVKLEALESMMPPTLRTGRFKAMEALIASLRRVPKCGVKPPTIANQRGLNLMEPRVTIRSAFCLDHVIVWNERSPTHAWTLPGLLSRVAHSPRAGQGCADPADYATASQRRDRSSPPRRRGATPLRTSRRLTIVLAGQPRRSCSWSHPLCNQVVHSDASVALPDSQVACRRSCPTSRRGSSGSPTEFLVVTFDGAILARTLAQSPSTDDVPVVQTSRRIIVTRCRS